MTLDTLKYGNPTKKDLSLIETKSPILDIFQNVVADCPNAPSQLSTQTDINDLIENIKDISLPENQSVKNLYVSIDQNINQFLITVSEKCIYENLTLKEALDSGGYLSVKDLLKEIVDICDPIIYKLKYFYNRPRPTQYAANAKIKMFPVCNYKNETPSYPSRTVVISDVFIELLKNFSPVHAAELHEIKSAIHNARAYLGTNYWSDINLANMVAGEILVHDYIVKKYKI